MTWDFQSFFPPSSILETNFTHFRKQRGSKVRMRRCRSRTSFKWPSSRKLTSSYMCFHHSGEIYRVRFPSSYNCKTSHLALRHSHFILFQMPFSQHGSLTASFSHVVLQPCCPAPFPSSETERVSGWETSGACHIHWWSVTVLSTPPLDTMGFAYWPHVVGFWYPPEKAIVSFISIQIQAFKWGHRIRSIFTTCTGWFAFWKTLSTSADRPLSRCNVSASKEAASLGSIIHLKET